MGDIGEAAVNGVGSGIDSAIVVEEVEAVPPAQPLLKDTVSRPSLEDILETGAKIWSSQKRSTLSWKFFRPLDPNCLLGTKDEPLVIFCAICGPPLASQLVGITPGLIRYHHSNGTSSMKTHLTKLHTAEWCRAVEKEKTKVEQDKANSPAKRRKVEGTPTPGQLRLSFTGSREEKWGKKDPRQIQQCCGIAVYAAKTYIPLAHWDHPFTIAHYQQIIPAFTSPSRKQLTQKWVPRVAQETMERFVKPLLAQCETGSMTYDLWMSRGNLDIFGLVWHFLDASFKPCHVCLGLIQVESTKGDDVANSLKQILAKFEPIQLASRTIGENSDGGSNLQTMRKALSDYLRCDRFPSVPRFVGRCYGHIFSGIISGACLDANVVEEMPQISLKLTFKAFKECITWPRKSTPARKKWNQHCRAFGLSERLPPAPVNTRFASRIVFMQECLAYYQVINSLYSDPDIVSCPST